MKGSSLACTVACFVLAFSSAALAHGLPGAPRAPHGWRPPHRGELRFDARRDHHQMQSEIGLGQVVVAAPDAQPTPEPAGPAVVIEPVFVPVPAPAPEYVSTGPRIIEVGQVKDTPRTGNMPRIIYGDLPSHGAGGPEIIYGDSWR